MDVRYDVDLDYDTEYDCVSAGCDSICRCGRISNPRINSVNSWVIANHFADVGDLLQYYVIERYCAHLTTDDFRIGWDSGYYGDEIDTVELTDSVKQKIVEIKNLQGRDLIEFSLKNEYGDVLPQYKNRNWVHQERVLFGAVVLGIINRPNLNRGRIEFYKRNHHYFPTLLCELRDGVYRVIDGYHRYTAVQELGVKEINIIYYDREDKRLTEAFELIGAL